MCKKNNLNECMRIDKEMWSVNVRWFILRLRFILSLVEIEQAWFTPSLHCGICVIDDRLTFLGWISLLSSPSACKCVNEEWKLSRKRTKRIKEKERQSSFTSRCIFSSTDRYRLKSAPTIIGMLLKNIDLFNCCRIYFDARCSMKYLVPCEY